MKISQTFFTDDLKDYLNLDNSVDNKHISDFRKVNFFIGPNNSGKSRIMRSMFFGCTDSIYTAPLTFEFQDSVSQILEKIKSVGLETIDDITHLTKGILFQSRYSDFDIDEKQIESITYDPKVDINVAHFFSNTFKRDIFLRNLIELSMNSRTHFEIVKPLLDKLKPDFIYIPIIRGTRPLYENSINDIYVERTIKDYFLNFKKNNSHSIFGGDNLYSQVENLLLGNAEERKLISDYEDFLSTHFFHKKVTIIPQRKQDVLLIKIGDEKERLIYNLGDGVQAIILLTFPIFIRKNNNCIFFIEEPELNLHPSLQRRILNCLSCEFPDHQYFISTHSNHFLEGISEYDNVALYSFKKSFKEDQFHVNKLTSIKTDILDNLGVKNSSVLIANCTIWVEGITDRLYIQKFLEVYTNYRTSNDGLDFPLFKEDQHYSFVEYAGSNIVHWSFDKTSDDKINAAYVSNNILLISDTDYNRTGNIPSSKIKRFDKLKSSLGKNFILIDGKEIENILSPKIIHAVVADYEKVSIEKITFEKSKILNKKKNVGEWINNSFTPITRNYAKDYTISDKTNFCKKAISKIKTREDLTEEAKILCKKIYTYIKDHNTDYIETN